MCGCIGVGNALGMARESVLWRRTLLAMERVLMQLVQEAEYRPWVAATDQHP
jgi:hypothetical protein